MVSIVNPAPSLRHAFPLFTLSELPWQLYRESNFWKAKERKRTVLFTIFYLANGLKRRSWRLASDRYTTIMGCQTFHGIALSSYSMHLVQAIDQIPSMWTFLILRICNFACGRTPHWFLSVSNWNCTPSKHRKAGEDIILSIPSIIDNVVIYMIIHQIHHD